MREDYLISSVKAISAIVYKYIMLHSVNQCICMYNVCMKIYSKKVYGCN